MSEEVWDSNSKYRYTGFTNVNEYLNNIKQFPTEWLRDTKFITRKEPPPMSPQELATYYGFKSLEEYNRHLEVYKYSDLESK